MKKIPLLGKDSQGKFVLVDDEDMANLTLDKWYMSRYGYAVRDNRGTARQVMMHRLVLSATKGQFVDHINGDKLDNRRVNLRICTRTESCRNQPMYKNNTSGYKGVGLQKALVGSRNLNVWRATIVVSGRKLSLGYYSTPREAAKAYNKAALRYHREFARLNEL